MFLDQDPQTGKLHQKWGKRYLSMHCYSLVAFCLDKIPVVAEGKRAEAMKLQQNLFYSVSENFS